VRALFVQNKVRFARAEQLCAPCMMHQRFALGDNYGCTMGYSRYRRRP